MSSAEQASVAVIGMGTVGAMAAWQLSKLVPGRIIGIEQYGVAHAYGAYAGESRLFRTAAYEGEHYTPLLVRSQQLWRELERESGQSIYLQVGALTIAPGASPKIAGTLEAAERFPSPTNIWRDASCAAGSRSTTSTTATRRSSISAAAACAPSAPFSPQHHSPSAEAPRSGTALGCSASTSTTGGTS